MDKPGTEKTDTLRPYVKPRLHVYGDVREITLNVGPNSKKNDSGGGGQTKTF